MHWETEMASSFEERANSSHSSTVILQRVGTITVMQAVIVSRVGVGSLPTNECSVKSLRFERMNRQ